MATTPTTTTPPSTPIIYGPLNIEYLNESWCELQYKSGCSSTGSISHLNHSVNPEVLEKLLQEAQKESQSPVSNGPPLLPLLPDITNQTKTPPLLKSFDSFSTMSSVCLVNNNNNSACHQDQKTVNNNNTSSSTTTIHNKTRDTIVSSTSSEIISVVPMSDTSSVVYSQTSGKLKMRIVGSENRSSVKPPSAAASSSMFMPIRRESSSEADACVASRMFVYDDDDDDDEIFCQDEDMDDDDESVDLEYVEDEEDEECNRINNLNNNTLTDQAAGGGGGKLIHNEMKLRQRNKKRKHHDESCKHCNKHRQEITSLLEKQIAQEKELIRLRNEYEIKLLNKSLELSTHSSKSSASNNNNNISNSNQTRVINATSSPQSGVGLLSPPPSFSSCSSNADGQTSPIYPSAAAPFAQSHQEVIGNVVGGGGVGSGGVINTKDWMKYFASRPQSLPPKEWNLVHPNSQQSVGGGLVAQQQQQTKLVGSSRVSDNLAVDVTKTPRHDDDLMIMSPPNLIQCSAFTNTDTSSSLKLLGSESVSISKLIFTHVASFIVGATLMFLVLRKHLNFRGSIYFI